MGEPDRPPRPPLNLVGDYAGGAMMLVTGVLAALLEAKTTGRGRVVDAAMTDGSALLMSLFQALGARGLWSETRGANLLDGGAPFYRCYTCADGRYVAVGALEPQFYAALISGLGLTPEAAPQFDLAGWPGLHARFEAIFATRDRDDWAERFADTDACVTPVLTGAEAARHPHNAARGTFVDPGVVQAAPAPRFNGTPAEPAAATAPISLSEARSRWT
jgi:alpha-methylacyl-CoA racemase